jgi:hypothetical protein
MKTGIILAVVLGASVWGRPARAETQTTTHESTREKTMMSQATGTFDVKVKPLPEDEKVAGVTVGRMSIEKEWKGDIVGTSKGEMMTAAGEVKGSAGYVAVEVMKVSIKGRSGTFTLMHHATMKHEGDFRMLINVIPDSATGELKGLSGALTIIIEPGKHSYKFDYALPEAP